MRDAFVRQLSTMAAHDPRVMLITADLGFNVLTGFAESYPKQYINAGVAEQNMTGLATGLAMGGRIVYTYSIANFPVLRCLEQIRNDACYHEANVKVVAVGGGFGYGALGISHHATEDLAVMRSLPNMTVVAPGDAWEAEQATAAVGRVNGTCYLRLDRSTIPPTNRPGEEFRIGQARRLREGNDITIIAVGGILEVALRAADQLSNGGLECRVLSMHTVKPIDSDAILEACTETGGIVTLEEHTVDGGLGSAVAETCLDSGTYPRSFRRIGLRAGFSSIVGSQSYLRTRYGLDEPAVVAAVEAAARQHAYSVV